MSAHQMTSDLETLTFDHGQKVMPQIEELTQNVAYGTGGGGGASDVSSKYLAVTERLSLVTEYIFRHVTIHNN